jgi:hypothetical protein
MSIGARGNHKLSIDTTFDPCKFLLDSTFNGGKQLANRHNKSKAEMKYSAGMSQHFSGLVLCQTSC